MTKFMIITQPRSGSTWFMSCLNSHPQIYCPKIPTVFSKYNLSPFKGFKPGFLQVDNPKSPYYAYRSASLKRQLAHRFRRKKLVYSFLCDLYADRRDAKAVGYKINYSQMRKYPVTVSWIKENNVRIIQLVRYNLLKRLVSHKIANARHLLHSKQSVAPIKVTIDPKILIDDFQRRDKRFEKYRKRFMDDLGVPYHEVTYESLLSEHNAEMKKTLQFLGVDQDFSLSSEYVKVNPDSLEQLIDNFDDIKKALADTPFNTYLN